MKFKTESTSQAAHGGYRTVVRKPVERGKSRSASQTTPNPEPVPEPAPETAPPPAPAEAKIVSDMPQLLAPLGFGPVAGGYRGTGQAVLLRDNQQIFLLQQQQIAAGSSTMAVQLERINRSFYPWGLSFQLAFTDVNGNPASPGTFELDIQTSDIDQDNQYVGATANQITTVNTNNVARLELTTLYAKYVRGFMKTLGNSVYVTLLATR